MAYRIVALVRHMISPKSYSSILIRLFSTFGQAQIRPMMLRGSKMSRVWERTISVRLLAQLAQQQVGIYSLFS